MKSRRSFDVVTVTLNPAIDRTLTISNFAVGKVNRVESVREDAGGKGVNVATALADFGFSIAVTGFLGTDNAAVFENLFARKKIIDHFVRLTGPTRVGIKITDPAQEQTTDVNFPGLSPNAAAVKRLFRSIVSMANEKPQWFVLGGSLPPKVNVEIYGELISTLKRRGHKVLLDTSGQPFRHGIEAAPNIIKPNLHELEELIGKSLKSDRAIIQAARQLIAGGVELVVVSIGERGACFVTEQEAIIARPPRVKVKSTVGAGDAMVAGIIAAHLRHESLEDCARLATAFSLETLTCIDRSLRSPAAVKNWRKRVKIF
ncbi:MAG: 1-phosphofructokinase [Verrucomicrobiales bacterium]|nr:1-phosphofructokinase [Verrucomicrobiales bacterium]